jgi:glutamine synthetase
MSDVDALAAADQQIAFRETVRAIARQHQLKMIIFFIFARGLMIFAGLDGIRRHLKLSESVNVDPGNLSETERQVQNIDFLPTNLGESIELLKQDNFLLDAMGADLAQAYLAVRSAEWEAIKDWSLEEEVKLLLERY